jgi:hypothetical protein
LGLYRIYFAPREARVVLVVIDVMKEAMEIGPLPVVWIALLSGFVRYLEHELSPPLLHAPTPPRHPTPPGHYTLQLVAVVVVEVVVVEVALGEVQAVLVVMAIDAWRLFPCARPILDPIDPLRIESYLRGV